MKFALPTLVALFAALPTFAANSVTLANELANPLTVRIVTQWEQADFGGLTVAGSNTTFPVDDEEYTQVDVYGPSKKAAAVSPLFAVKRDVWDNYHYWCDVTVTGDPGVPDVHIIFEEKDEKLHAYANKHEDTVKVDCGDKLEGQ